MLKRRMLMVLEFSLRPVHTERLEKWFWKISIDRIPSYIETTLILLKKKELFAQTESATYIMAGSQCSGEGLYIVYETKPIGESKFLVTKARKTVPVEERVAKLLREQGDEVKIIVKNKDKK